MSTRDSAFPACGETAKTVLDGVATIGASAFAEGVDFGATIAPYVCLIVATESELSMHEASTLCEEHNEGMLLIVARQLARVSGLDVFELSLDEMRLVQLYRESQRSVPHGEA